MVTGTLVYLSDYEEKSRMAEDRMLKWTQEEESHD
jgi:hypothetical protein